MTVHIHTVQKLYQYKGNHVRSETEHFVRGQDFTMRTKTHLRRLKSKLSKYDISHEKNVLYIPVRY